MVLAKVNHSILFESFMDLQNAKLSSGSDLFLADVFEKAVEKSLKALHDEAMWKAVSCDKPALKGKKAAFLSTCSDCSSPKGLQGLRPDRSSRPCNPLTLFAPV